MSEVITQSETDSEGPQQHVKKFVFRANPRQAEGEVLEVVIPERLHASYGMYTWPCAPVLAWFLWEHREQIRGKRVLEIGAGTALPGIVAAKCGASVILSDSAKLPKCLENCRKSCEANELADQVQVIGLTWGLFLSEVVNLGSIDFILGADCFYDPSVFEDILVTVAFLLEKNPLTRFLCAYQERSADWSVEHLLRKWRLQCELIPIKSLAAKAGIDFLELTQGHTIQLLEITRI